MPEITFREALNQAMAEEMERDPNVFLMGEEVGDGDPAEGGEVPEPSTLLLLLPLVGFGLKRLSFAGKKR